jgi:drug/metabolite transporter (DMT)-like permease
VTSTATSLARTEAAAKPSVGWSTLLLLGGLALFWGLNWPAMKFVLDEIPVLTFRTLCLWVTGPVLLLLARLGGEPIGMPWREWRALIPTAFCNVTAWYYGTAMALTLIPAGRAALLAYTMPLWVALLSALVLRERLDLRQLAGLALGLVGVGVLIAPEVETIRAAPLGAVCILGAAVGWAVGTVGMKLFRFSRSVAQITGWQLLIGGTPIAVAAALHDPLPNFAVFDAPTLWVLAYIIALPMIFGQWAWFKSLSRLPGTVASIGSLAVPAVGLLSSAVLLGERLGASEIAALVLVMTALCFVLIRPASPAKQDAARGAAKP